ncbi:MAG: 1,4-alpha-glucan branching protein GlgB [Alphaproteobacteria bacterium]|nr:1,4-alpha-glucan branching protein GlgB [Alphaproteobacteria bacterium]
MFQKKQDTVLKALVKEGYGDPFSILGMHEDEKGLLFVRVFLPRAETVELLDLESKESFGFFEKEQREGVFLFSFQQKRDFFKYSLKIKTKEGLIYESIDPYQFLPVLSDLDVYLIGQGEHKELYKKLGAHLMTHQGVKGVHFGVWAPNANRVSVVGDFNEWDGRRHVMRPLGGSGIWEIFIPQMKEGDVYKYEILSKNGKIGSLKSDPVGFYQEVRPKTASIVYPLSRYEWGDKKWCKDGRKKVNDIAAPISIYEVHLGSWRYKVEENRPLNYKELAKELPKYVKEMGFTHVEFLPISEHPFDGSWGYQVIGLYAPTSRYGTPDEFKMLIDALHQEGISVIIDWVPGHFPKDDNGLSFFDGTALYEHEDSRKGEHKEWGTKIYNYGRKEVSNFLLSNALFWVKEYHIDGFRVDAVASMLYLDYERKSGEWVPNQYGGRENIEAIDFIRKFNEQVYALEENVITCAEESTAWPMVSRPTYLGGLGFTFKWNMGWMHDTLDYMHQEPIYRKYRQSELTFSFVYAFSENFILPLSHDEVVHGKGPLWDKMPGDLWQKMANLRAYFGFMFSHPGKKLLFQGGEFAQNKEWKYDESLSWHLLQNPSHKAVQTLVKDLNSLYRAIPFLGAYDCSSEGFEWIDGSDCDCSVVSFIRKGKKENEILISVSNFTPIVRENYQVGTPFKGEYIEVLNTDDLKYGGSGVVNKGTLQTHEPGWNFKPYALTLTLAPLSTILLKVKTDAK